MLERFESTMGAMRTKLLKDEMLRKLLYHDSNNALQMLPPTEQEVQDYITLKPIFDFENKKNYDKNSSINIYMTSVDPQLDNVTADAIIQVNVVCNIDIWDLVNNKIRPVQIANRIITLLNNQKFTASNSLVFNSLDNLIVSKHMVGYALLFELTDGSGINNKF